MIVVTVSRYSPLRHQLPALVCCPSTQLDCVEVESGKRGGRILAWIFGQRSLVAAASAAAWI
jgi:hypothetical protein